jgi:hypothetical protein
MIKLSTKLGAAVAMAAVIASTLAPAAFANGSKPKGVTINNTNNTPVTQKNKTLIVNGVLSVSNTGGINVGKNDDGKVKIKTGNTNTTVTINNTGSSNNATLTNCGCPNQGAVTTLDQGNGPNNSVTVNNSSTLTVQQTNKTAIINVVGVISNTGLINVNGTDDGKTVITTGSTNTDISINNTGSSNSVTQL